MWLVPLQKLAACKVVIMSSNPQKDYTDLLKLVTQDEASQQDVYTELLARESKVLDVVSRIATQSRLEDSIKRSVMKMSIPDLVTKFSHAWMQIFRELIVVEKQAYTILDVILKDDRKIYVGMMFIVLAFFAFFTSIASDD